MSQPEKSWKQSKKFIAYAVANIIWTTLMIIAFFAVDDDYSKAMILLVMSSCLAFLQVVYIGGQSAVDALVRYAAAISSGFSKTASLPSSTSKEEGTDITP